MKRTSRIGLGITLGLLLGLPLGTVYTVIAKSPVEQESLPLKELRIFTDVYKRIKSDYVEDIEDQKLIEHAIRGMLTGLDPHSNYMDAEQFRELTIDTTGEFGGLGIEVGMEDGFVKVISPIDDTPADKAGVQAGDLIIRLDETPVKGLSLNEAVEIMRGEVGSDIELLIVREGEAQPLNIVITRAVIKVQSVRSRELDPGFGYLRIASFQSRTSQNLVEQINKLKENGPLKGVILDLRNNPGGVLNGAVGVSDAFLESGLIVYTEGRIADSELRYDASPGDEIGGVPLIVLVNGGSASASEIVAGALQDHGRALILGSKTFGKGSVQTILPLREGNALKMTTARYYTPKGTSIQADGIVPDIEISPLQLTKREDSGFTRIRESDLSGHLENADGDEQSEAADEEEIPLAQSDYELYEALNLLKGMVLLSKKN